MADIFRVKSSVVDLLDKPDGLLQRQLIFGDGFCVQDISDGWAKGYRLADEYHGYVAADQLAGWADPTNYVRDLGAHVYPSPDIKTVPLMHLPYQSNLTVVDETGQFAELAGGGFIHQRQIASLAVVEPDYLRTAERYLGVPYLWGGNSQYGLDCSGLVSAALRGAGIACAADSGEQEKTLGIKIDRLDYLQRGDFVFWKGHVGLMYSPDLLLHANGHHMKVVFEPLENARARILTNGGGDVTAVKRL